MTRVIPASDFAGQLQIRRLRELVGITHFNCGFWFGDMEQARVLSSMERFAQEVMPAVA